MQNAKDTFYVTLRDRLAAVNASRTVSVRGQVRPAVVVDENEMPERDADAGVFHLQWGDVSTERAGAVLLDAMECRIVFRASGANALSTLTRGREMSAMQAELDAMLLPAWAVKKRFSEDGAVAMGTNVFWCEVGERVVKVKEALLEATAVVTVMAYREEGE